MAYAHLDQRICFCIQIDFPDGDRYCVYTQNTSILDPPL